MAASLILSSEDLTQLQRVGCFGISTYDRWKIKDREVGELEACRRFVGPLLATAYEARLFGAKHTSNTIIAAADILIPRRGYHEVDLTRECVTGHEAFWRAGAGGGEWLRGTVAVTHAASIDLAPLLVDCVMYGFLSSRYQLLKGSSAAAVRFADRQVRRGYRCFVFSASNGVEHVEVFCPPTQLGSDYIRASEAANKPGWQGV